MAPRRPSWRPPGPERGPRGVSASAICARRRERFDTPPETSQAPPESGYRCPQLAPGSSERPAPAWSEGERAEEEERSLDRARPPKRVCAAHMGQQRRASSGRCTSGPSLRAGPSCRTTRTPKAHHAACRQIEVEMHLDLTPESRLGKTCVGRVDCARQIILRC